VFYDLALARKIRLHNLHAAGKQHEEGDFAIARLEQDFSRLDFSQLAAATHTTDLRRS
jgi:hypothetical protein